MGVTMMVKSFRMKALIAGAAVAAAVSAGAVSDVPAAKVLQPTAAYAAETVFSQNNGASGFLPRYDVQAMAACHV